MTLVNCAQCDDCKHLIPVGELRGGIDAEGHDDYLWCLQCIKTREADGTGKEDREDTRTWAEA